MSSKLSPYSPPAQIRSSLLKNSSDIVPPTDELEVLHAELKVLKQRTLERAKKAGEDLKTIEESMRRMKEKEKGKARAVEKVKRERDFTPLPEADEVRLANSMSSVPPKPRPGSLPVTSGPLNSARSSVDPRRSAADDLKKKKKYKRKRDFDDSDAESEHPRPRKTSPVAPPPPAKAQKTTTIISQAYAKAPSGPDFSVPQPYPLLPLRPPIPPPPLPGPSKPSEVMEDFSKAKAPSQTVVTTFYSSIEPWIRNIKEEDVGFLEFTADEVEPFIMPKLGRHYTEVWEDEDIALYGGALPGFTAVRPGGAAQASASASSLAASSAPVPKWDPSTLMEPDLLTEERGHGPLTERLISALLPMPDISGWKGVKAAEDAMEGRPGGSGAAAAARREKMNVSDLEERIRDTMRFHGLLHGVPDYSEKVDDPIATALRHAQRELRTVVATNKKRKERLAAIARDRLAYQEYIELRDSIDKNISNTYTKLQRKDAPKASKKKKKAAEAPGPGAAAASVPPVPPPTPAALGLGPDDENRLVVSEQLRQLVETRRQWVDTVGAVFEEKNRESPGRIWGFPKSSVYEGIEEEVRALLAGEEPAQRTNTGKGKARGDDMDVG